MAWHQRTTILLTLAVWLAAAAAESVRADDRPAEPRPPEANINPPKPVPPKPKPAAPQNGRRLSDVSLEELMNIEVSSVSRKEQKLNQTAAAVYVVTQEDIRRSGANSIPEALRMVPGLQVAQIDGSKWAISARGFAGRFANKMLVLIDGRSVYNMLYSGVFWEQNDIVLEDVDRIEVIRGPGATMWGANAVNGVINIITKTAKQTQGNLVSTSVGNVEQPSVAARHGGRIGNRAHYRTYTKYSNRGNMRQADGSSAYDGWNSVRGGGRVDFEINSRDSFTAQADLFRTTARQSYYENFPLISFSPVNRYDTGHSGAFVSARWRRVVSERSDFAVQAYYDSRNFRDYMGAADLNTVDVDFQHRFHLSARHELLWGGGYRLSQTNLRTIGNRFRFDPPDRIDNLASTFIQDDVGLIPDRLILSVGSKFLHNSYTGFEVQPSLRLMYLATARQSLWAAASRAVRTPSRADHGAHVEYSVPGAAIPTTGLILGDPHIGSESVLAYEAGYRNQLNKYVSLDVAGFYNIYSHLNELRPLPPYFATEPVRQLVLPALFTHSRSGRTYGLELATTFSPAARWKWHANYSWLRRPVGNLDALSLANFELSAPTHQVQVRSSLDLTRRLSLDSSLYYVDALRGIGVPAYVRLDTRLGWRVSEQLELSVLGQNLLDDRHLEFRSEDFALSTEIRRAFLIRLLWLF